MASLPLTLAIRNYDYISPLATGDIKIEGVDLTLYRGFDSLARTTSDPTVLSGESSFSRYIHRIASGDRSLVGIPAFVMRGFRHRCFFVRKGSGLTDLPHLAGKRVGTNEWPATGNTWTRATLRERGVAIDSIRWVVGPVNAGYPSATDAVIPPIAEHAPEGRSLVDLLVAGEIDAIMCPWPPAGFYDADSPMTRLFEDFRAAEHAYYQRTRIFPAHHIVVLKRAVVDQHPWIVRAVYDGLVASLEASIENHWAQVETTPWLLAEMEETVALMGQDFMPYGVEPNRHMIEAFCEEQYAQGLVSQPLDAGSLFADFEASPGR